MPSPLHRVIIGAFHPPSPWDGMEAFTALERKLGAELGVVHQFIGWGAQWPEPDPEVVERARGRVDLVRRLFDDAYQRAIALADDLPVWIASPPRPSRGSTRTRSAATRG